ncbi:MAG: efflux RND transporter periplasmic adaptor subunit [Armatimonadetes bacterium]|nr:efflux RND transporter periplasmic adaptor subunit [Armatimonadota bacterium]
MKQNSMPERLGFAGDDFEYIEEEGAPCPPIKIARPHRSWRSIVMSNWQRGAKLLAAGLLGLGIYSYVSAPPVVQFITVKTVDATQTLGATGKVRGERVADLGLDSAGVIKRIYVHDGDMLQAGQLMISLDTSIMEQRVASARSSLDSAIAEHAKASRGSLPSEIARAQAELSQAQSVGQAKLEESQARYRHLKAGARSQEISAAQADLQSKSDLLRKAETDLKRNQKLVSQGAMARASLDSAQTDVETANSAVFAGQARVDLLKEGATSDELAEANAAVAEAKASRDTSVRASREALNTLLAYPRDEDVRAAQAKVEQAQAELMAEIGSRAKSNLRAPFDGAVADIAVEEGQSISPGQKLVTFHEISRPIIEVETDEENLSDLAIGQIAIVTADAYPGKSFKAALFDMGSMVNPDRGTVQIKLRPMERVSWLRPDLTVDVNIITKKSVRSIMVPPDALTRNRGETAVLVIRDGVGVLVAIKTGAMGHEGIVINGGLRDGDKVVRNAGRVKPNGRVRMAQGNQDSE